MAIGAFSVGVVVLSLAGAVLGGCGSDVSLLPSRGGAGGGGSTSSTSASATATSASATSVTSSASTSEASSTSSGAGGYYDPGSELVTFDGGVFVNRLAVDGSGIYAASDNAGSALFHVSFDGAATQLWTSPKHVFSGLALDDDAVYFLDYTQGPLRLPKAGGNTALLAGLGQPFYAGLAVAQGKVFWGEGTSSSEVYAVATDGSSSALIADMEDPVLFTSDGVNVYWSAWTGEVRAIPVAGGQVSTVISGLMQPVAVAVDEAFVYVTDGPLVYRAPKEGGPPELVAEGLYRALSLAVDDTWVWFLDTKDISGYDALRRAPKAGGEVETIVTSPNHLTALAVDAANLYWAEAFHLRVLPK